MIANPASGQPAAVSGRPAAEPAVRVAGLRKHYGGVVALGGVELTVARGEFFALLGPSGSGKTTLLRLIAGFEQPDAGQIELAGRIVTRVPPYARNVNTVFQDYALFPHMTVAENIEYALRVRRMPKPERREKAGRALEMVRLSGLGHRKPAELSGGQRQRVALARAIVNEPEVLLLDEPLGALDLKLRQEMQLELQHVQREVGITFLYVTHDQEEALSMSDAAAKTSALLMGLEKLRVRDVIIAYPSPGRGLFSCPCEIVNAWSARQAMRTRRPRVSGESTGASAFCRATTS